MKIHQAGISGDGNISSMRCFVMRNMHTSWVQWSQTLRALKDAVRSTHHVMLMARFSGGNLADAASGSSCSPAFYISDFAPPRSRPSFLY